MLKWELQRASFRASCVLSSSQKFLRICSETREMLISCSDCANFCSSFSSKPMFIFICLASWSRSESISLFWSSILLVRRVNFFLYTSLSKIAFSRSSCITSNLFLTCSSSFDRCSVNLRSPRTVPPRFKSDYPPREPVCMVCLLALIEGPTVAAYILPYLRRSPFL